MITIILLSYRQLGVSYRSLIVFLLFTLSSLSCADVLSEKKFSEKRVIEVATQMSYSNERSLMMTLFKDFERVYPDIKVVTHFYRGDSTDELEKWVAQGSGPDVIYWYGKKHIERLAGRGGLKDLSAIWEKYDLHSDFSASSREVVSADGKIYGLPMAQYLWGLYFRESILQSFDLKIPATWSQLLAACRKTASQNHHFMALATKQVWALNAWFDYLTLRLHGVEFYHQLLQNKQDWGGAEIREVFEHFKQLIDAECFDFERHASIDVRAMLPRLYQGLNSVALVGGFVVADLHESIRDDFSVAAFPQIRDDIAMHAVAPVDTYVVASYATIDSAMEKLLLYLSSPRFQQACVENTARVPMHLAARERLQTDLQLQSAAILGQGETTQFLDRDSHPLLSKVVSEVFDDFLKHQNVDITLRLLRERMTQFYQDYPETATNTKRDGEL